MLKIGKYELTAENLKDLSLLEKIKITISLFTVFNLLYRAPKIIKTILKNTILFKEDINDEIIGFAYDMASRIPWYYKISNMINKYGLYGYVYEDGLGSSLKERFFHHYLTYGLLFNKLKVRRYTIISAFLFVVFIIIVGILMNNLVVLFLVIPIIIISPFFTFSYFTRSKPEILAWSFTPLLFYFIINGSLIPSALILIVLSFLSFSVLFFSSFSFFAFSLLGGMNFVTLILIYIPVTIKISVDLFPFFKHIGIRTFENMLGQKKRYTVTEEGNFGLRPLEVFFIVAYSILPISLYFTDVGLPHVAMTVAPIVLMIVNYTVYRLADEHTFFRIFLVLSSFYAVVYPSYLYLVCYTLVMLIHPNLFEYGLNYSNKVEDGLHEYPLIMPIKIGRESIDKINDFFSKADVGSRIAFESDKITIKNVGGYNNFSSLAEYITLNRELEILPGEWLRLYHRNFFINSLTSLNENSDIKAIIEICDEAGINYLLCYTKSFVDMLTKNDFKIVAELDYDVIQKSCVGEMLTPKKKLYLIKCPLETGIIEPLTNYIKKPNKIEFDAIKEQEYIIKYTYHPSWKAVQGGKELKVEKFEKKGLSFMMLKSITNEKIVMEFSHLTIPFKKVIKNKGQNNVS